MKILVDIGNSRVKWTTLDKGGIGESQNFQRSKTGIKAALNKAWKSLTGIDAVYVANVGGNKLSEQLSEWTEKHWQLQPIFITTEQKRFGVTNAYEEPEKLGIDRWLALIAARQHAREAQCVIDCGTAMTIDIVSKTGQHQGGMILPGLSLMRTSLAANTDALTEEPDEKEFKTLATNTFSAIQVGTLYSVSATLERIIADLKESFNNKIRFIITGGDAEHVLPLLPEDIHHYPDIVLKGLAFYAREADKKKRPPKKPAAPKPDKGTEPVANQEKSDASDSENTEDANKARPKSKPRRPRRKKTAESETKAVTETENPDSTLPGETI